MIQAQENKLVPRKWRCLCIMIGWIIMDDLADQEVLLGINVIIPQGTRPEKHMYDQGRKAAQVYILSCIIE
jgi:hypothetical protein